MLILEIVDQSGYPDIYVTTQSPLTNAVLGWVAPGFPMPSTYYRRQARIPLKIHNPDPTDYESPTDVELVSYSGGPPAIKDAITLTLIDWLSGDTIRELTVSVPFPSLVVGSKAKLASGASALCFNRTCLFDLSGIPNNPMPSTRMYAMYIQSNLPGGFASYSTPVRIGAMQMRHGVNLDVL